MNGLLSTLALPVVLGLSWTAAALAQPAPDQKPFTLDNGTVRVRINPSRAYTMDTVWLGQDMVGQPNGNYGFAYHAGEAKFIGSGHTEGGKEQVQQVDVLVDGKPVAAPFAADVRGKAIELIKRSKVGTLGQVNRIQLEGDRISEEVQIEALEPTKIVTSYAFMHCWRPVTTQWMAMTLDSRLLEGEFNNEGWELKTDVRWLALWDPEAKTIILTEFPADMPPGQGIRHAIWDLKAYHKQYFQPWNNTTLEPGKKHTFRMTTRLLRSEQEQWKKKAKAEAYEYEGGYHKAEKPQAVDPASQSEMSRKVQALYPPLDPAKTPQWLAQPVAMEALDPDTVLVPWSPVEATDQSVKVWGRTITLDAWGLPAQVESAGQTLLAAPVQLNLQVAGQAKPLTPARRTLADRRKGRVQYQTQAQGGGVNVGLQSSFEYDGFSRYDLKLNAGQPIKVDRLSLVVPLRPDQARFLQHASAWNLGMSQQLTAVSQEVPSGTGEVYAYGFSPFLWLGGYDAGFSWYAQSDEHWYPMKSAKATRLVRAADRVELHIDLIAEPTELPDGATFTFGFMATPVKPMPQGWRSWRVTTEDPARRKNEMHDQVGNQIIYWNDRWRIVHHYPLPRDPAAFKDAVAKLHAHGAQRVYPYLDVTLMSAGDKTTIPGESFYFLPPEWPVYGASWMNQPNYGAAPYKRVTPASSWADFSLWCVKQWITEGGATGIYLDEGFPYADTDASHGMGYTDRSGVRQPTYPLFATRDFYKRLAYLFQRYAKGPPALLAHTSATIAVPYLSFADIQLTGEQYYHSMRKWDGPGYASYVKMAPPEDFHAEHRGTQFGFVPCLLPLYKPPHSTKWPEVITTEGPMRELSAVALIHDVLIWPNFANPQPALRTQRIKDLFGVAAPEAEFFPYWKPDPNGVAAGVPESVKVSYYRNKTGLLIALGNLGDQPQTVALDISKANQGSSPTAVNPEDNQAIAVADGKLNVTVPSRDYRLVQVNVK